MGVNRSVFASHSERKNYEKLCRTWGESYHIHHNLPFLNVFNTKDLIDITDWRRGKFETIALSDSDLARLKKTSIDYTLCDQNDAPILCIEFDGLQEGFNVGKKYHPSSRSDVPASPWRQQIMELKLKVAFGSMFPYFIVGSKYFQDLSADVRLMIIDGIIGDVLASRAVQTRFAEPFDPEELGLSQEEFDALAPSEQDEMVQDWVLGVEIGADMEHNPVSRASGRLRTELAISSWKVEYLEYPNADAAKTPIQRAEMINNATLCGARITLCTSDFGEVRSAVWLPNFQSFSPAGYGLAEEIAFIVAAAKLKRLRSQLA